MNSCLLANLSAGAGCARLTPSALAMPATLTLSGGTFSQCLPIASSLGSVTSWSMYSHVHPNASIRAT